MHGKTEGRLTKKWLNLKFLGYVPELKCNLLSLSRITKDLNCSVIFSPSDFKFQDLSSGRTIGNAEEQHGI